jgi:hypothetical protein
MPCAGPGTRFGNIGEKVISGSITDSRRCSHYESRPEFGQKARAGQQRRTSWLFSIQSPALGISSKRPMLLWRGRFWSHVVARYALFPIIALTDQYVETITANRNGPILTLDGTAPCPGIPRNVTEHTDLIDRAYHVGGMRLPEEVHILLLYGQPTANRSFGSYLNGIFCTECGECRCVVSVETFFVRSNKRTNLSLCFWICGVHLWHYI